MRLSEIILTHWSCSLQWHEVSAINRIGSSYCVSAELQIPILGLQRGKTWKSPKLWRAMRLTWMLQIRCAFHLNLNQNKCCVFMNCMSCSISCSIGPLSPLHVTTWPGPTVIMELLWSLSPCSSFFLSWIYFSTLRKRAQQCSLTQCVSTETRQCSCSWLYGLKPKLKNQVFNICVF